jgi:hypothetical protein
MLRWLSIMLQKQLKSDMAPTWVQHCGDGLVPRVTGPMHWLSWLMLHCACTSPAHANTSSAHIAIAITFDPSILHKLGPKPLRKE